MAIERAVTLTKPQAALLAEIAEKGVLYVKRYSRYGRTVLSLERKGLVKVVEPDYSGFAMDGWSVVGDHIAASSDPPISTPQGQELS